MKKILHMSNFKNFSILLGIACGVIIANIYYTHPLIRNISYSLGVTTFAGSFIAGLIQLGYAIGLLFLITLTSSRNHKKLILSLLAITAISLFLITQTSSIIYLSILALLIGIGASSAQVIIYYTSINFPEKNRKKAITYEITGIIIGIIFSRPIASFLAQIHSWQLIFYISSFCIFVIFMLFLFVFPSSNKQTELTYRASLKQLKQLIFKNKIFIRLTIYHTLLFSSFSLFWITVPLHLLSPIVGLNQGGVALFCLAGTMGIVLSTIAVEYADKGYKLIINGAAMLLVALSFILPFLAPTGSVLSLTLIIIAAIVLDTGIFTNFILGQRNIVRLSNILDANYLTSFYTGIFFIGGAIGSILGGFTYFSGGLPISSLTGGLIAFAAFLYYLTHQNYR